MGKKNNNVQNENNKENVVSENVDNSNIQENEIDCELSQLKKDFEQKEQEAKNHLESLQRIMAEFDNYKKRTIKEKESIYTDIKSDIMADFLEIVDNFDKALENITNDNVKEGVVLIQKKLLGVLDKYGVQEIDALNKTFDPNLHESIQHIDDEKYGEKEIVEVFRKGYKIGDRVIRYPMVKVAN